MVNQLSKGTVFVGDVETAYGQVVKALVGTIAQTDVTRKTLGVIPAGATIVAVKYFGATGSDAGTTATITVGNGATGHEYINGASVLGSAGVGQYSPSAAVGGAIGSSNVTVTGVYAESGTASATGGPYTIVIEYVTNVVS